jgi:hypothetical protein
MNESGGYGEHDGREETTGVGDAAIHRAVTGRSS